MPATNRPTSRSRLLTATEDMLRESGMAGTGIKDVVARSGAPIGSLYHHFPRGKMQLVSEALAIHAERFPRLLERFFDGKRSAAAALDALFTTAAAEFERQGAAKGCAIGAVALDLVASDADIRRVCHQAFDDWAASLAPRLPFPDAATRRSFAVAIVVALEGAFVLARAAGDGEPFREAGRWIVAALSATTSRRRIKRRRSSRKPTTAP
jgi:AcrR family transcriptional regulator